MIEWEHLHPMRRAASAAGGKNEKAGAKTMGISHEYHSTSHRARHGGSERQAAPGRGGAGHFGAGLRHYRHSGKRCIGQGRTVGAGGQRHCTRTFWHRCPCRAKRQTVTAAADSTAPDGSGDAQAVTLETFGPAQQDAARCGGQGLRRQRHPSAQLRAGGPELFCGRGLSG